MQTAMKAKSLTLISITLMFFLFLIYSFNDLLFYSEVKYGDIHEHLDLRMQGVDLTSHIILLMISLNWLFQREYMVLV